MEQTAPMTNRDKLQAIYHLTRWRDHVPFVVPLTLMGAMMAVAQSGASVDWRLIPILLANIITMSAAFIINDIEDAPDDALDPKKRERNVISNGTLDAATGRLAFWLACAVAFALFALGGAWTALWGGVTLVVVYTYSARPIRLKSRRIVDVISHAYGGGTQVIIVGYFLYDANPGPAWYIIIAITLVSAYGQFYNQLDDYEVDKQAGLNNTTILLGKNLSTVIMYACIVIPVICILLALQAEVFPQWLATVALIGALTCVMFPWRTDMRGNEAGVHVIQVPVLLIFNLTTMMWVASDLGLLAGAA